MPRYYTVKLCIALQNPGFTDFLAEGLEKPKFGFSSGIINLLFYTMQLAKYLRVFYMLNHRIQCMYM